MHQGFPSIIAFFMLLLYKRQIWRRKKQYNNFVKHCIIIPTCHISVTWYLLLFGLHLRALLDCFCCVWPIKKFFLLSDEVLQATHWHAIEHLIVTTKTIISKECVNSVSFLLGLHFWKMCSECYLTELPSLKQYVTLGWRSGILSDGETFLGNSLLRYNIKKLI